MPVYTPLNLPPFPFKIREENGLSYIFDDIRRKYLLLTPEEWVRQHFIKYLVVQKKYPKSLIRVEGGLTVNTLKKRSDILVYNTAGEKIMLVECKAPGVRIAQQTFDQAARYNLVHKAGLLAVTNGLVHHCCRIDFDRGAYTFLPELPEYLSPI